MSAIDVINFATFDASKLSSEPVYKLSQGVVINLKYDGKQESPYVLHSYTL